jgi:hypothetical protein
MRQKNEKFKGVNQKPEIVGIKPAKITAAAVILAALITLIGVVVTSVYKREQDIPQIVVAFSPTPQLVSSLSPQVARSPAPLVSALAKTPVEQNSEQNKNQVEKLSKSETLDRNSNSIQQIRDNRQEALNRYIDDYLKDYSSVDLGDNPCDSEAKKLKNSAEALIGRIESLGTELKRKDALNFVSERRGFSIKFHDCKSSNS